MVVHLITDTAFMTQQLEFFEIPNPCRGACQSDEKGFCLGCMRSRTERFQWLSMDDTQKRDVLRLCRQRYQRFHRIKNQHETDVIDQLSLF